MSSSAAEVDEIGCAVGVEDFYELEMDFLSGGATEFCLGESG